MSAIEPTATDEGTHVIRVVRRGRREALPGAWSGTHLPALDGLRGVAVAGVLAFHDHRLTGGWLGVDLFFTLSGFLITSLLVAEVHRRGRVDLRDFWARRFRRLLPALLAVVGVLVVWGHVDPDGRFALTDLRGASLATLGYVANWYQLLAGGGYWDLFGSTPSPLEHTWSLAIEEQFYVVFPLVVAGVALLARRRGRGRGRPTMILQWVAGAGIAASLGATILLGRDGDTERVYLGTDTRLASILVGTVLATIAARRPGRLGGSGVQVAAWIAVPVLGVAWATVPGSSGLVAHGGLVVHAVLVALVIGAVSARPEGPLGRVLAVAPLQWLGTLSYGLYLWHWPVFVVVDERMVGDDLLRTAVRLSVAAGLAVLSLRLVEAPIRRGGVPARLRPVAALATVAVVVGAITLPDSGRNPSGGFAGGAGPSTLAPLPTLDPTADQTTTTVATTTTAPPPDVPTVETDEGIGAPRGRVGGAPRLLVLGDSVPELLTRPLPGSPEAGGMSVANRALPSCSPTAPEAVRITEEPLDFVPPDCLANWPGDARNFDPDIVVVSLNGDAFNELRFDGGWYETCSPEYAVRLGARLDAALDPFVARGSDVYILTPLPPEEWIRNPQYAERDRCLTDLLRLTAERHPGVALVRFGEWACPDLECRRELGGSPVVREDGVHYQGEDALTVWGILLPLLRLASRI